MLSGWLGEPLAKPTHRYAGGLHFLSPSFIMSFYLKISIVVVCISLARSRCGILYILFIYTTFARGVDLLLFYLVQYFPFLRVVGRGRL